MCGSAEYERNVSKKRFCFSDSAPELVFCCYYYPDPLTYRTFSGASHLVLARYCFGVAVTDSCCRRTVRLQIEKVKRDVDSGGRLQKLDVLEEVAPKE